MLIELQKFQDIPKSGIFRITPKVYLTDEIDDMGYFIKHM